LGDTLYTGFFDGSLVSWAGTGIKGTTKAHADGCHALCVRPAATPGLISGGGDGLIIIWA
jgi:hypothetical protein